MNRQLFKAAIVLTFVFVPSGLAKGQYPSYQSYPVYQAYPWYPTYFWSLEGWMHGYADILRAMGSYNLDSSQAERHMQEAISRAHDNHLKDVEIGIERKRKSQAWRVQQRRPPASKKQLASWNNARMPRRLTPDELDPATGKIHWPRALQGKAFAEARGELERLFARRAAGRGLDSEGAGEIRRLVEQMRSQLARKLRLEKLSCDDYTPAKQFLDSLAFEARFDRGFQPMARQ